MFLLCYQKSLEDKFGCMLSHPQIFNNNCVRGPNGNAHLKFSDSQSSVGFHRTLHLLNCFSISTDEMSPWMLITFNLFFLSVKTPWQGLLVLSEFQECQNQFFPELNRPIFAMWNVFFFEVGNENILRADQLLKDWDESIWKKLWSQSQYYFKTNFVCVYLYIYIYIYIYISKLSHTEYFSNIG